MNVKKPGPWVSRVYNLPTDMSLTVTDIREMWDYRGGQVPLQHMLRKMVDDKLITRENKGWYRKTSEDHARCVRMIKTVARALNNGWCAGMTQHLAKSDKTILTALGWYSK